MLNINDLLKQSQKATNIKPNISSSEDQEKLQKKLIDIELKDKEEKISAQARQIGISYINLVDFPVSQESLSLIPQEESLKYKLICFYRTEQTAKLASVQPDNPSLAEYREQIEGGYGLKTELYLISEHSFNFVYQRYATLPKISKAIKGVEITAKDVEFFKSKIKTFKDLNQEIKNAKITDLVNLIIASSIQSRASDIHIEAEEEEIKVRFRIDGVLIDVAEINKKFWPQIISRIKLISGLKMNIVDRPQDGRFTIFLTEEKVDVRVSCLPTAYGESVVMRLLRSSVASLSFEQLGFREEINNKLKQQIERPNGMVITTGPTGSGKTTTLYAILNRLNSPETKIITLEDPVEYHLKGINQSQVDKSKDYTFAKGLRSILRQDPDVVMVGEIRDLETAEIAIQAALTGHMVVSTLHTNDAAGAIPRFLSMGVKPYLLAPAINAVIGQRLVRKICPNCKQEIVISPGDMEKVKKILAEIPENSGIKINNDLKFYHGKGCEICQGLGYKGRIGIYEVFIIDASIEKIILGGDLSEYKMRELAQSQGMINMVQDGILKALEGTTTIEEIFRVAE
ncbi:MAG: GspE/PulE family protein [Patescibacteria group bacterium]|jgi:type IV pilus assembly protein PilB|nr:GspE/PulE family protein [Patescibacteria group bacterium]MDD5172593.1 GspE/PulE family protein [Patescibacteria group bacterium]